VTPSRHVCAALLVAVLAAAGCTTVPTSPSRLALPGTGKPFDVFRQDDEGCRQYAYEAIGGQTASAAQTDSAVRSTAAGAVVGALIGAAVNGGTGAAVGAGVGGGVGAIAGIGASDYSAYEAQRRYDNAYMQCMYGKGHRVAVNGTGGYARYAPAYYAPRYAYPAPAGYVYPPPPPGYYPPPPPPPGYYGW
jgi:outer membrane lipoprotein SlyB